MKKKLSFSKGIVKLCVPRLPEIEGESTRVLREAVKIMPKGTQVVTFQRKVSFDKDFPFDLTEVTYEK